MLSTIKSIQVAADSSYDLNVVVRLHEAAYNAIVRGLCSRSMRYMCKTVR